MLSGRICKYIYVLYWVFIQCCSIFVISHNKYSLYFTLRNLNLCFKNKEIFQQDYSRIIFTGDSRMSYLSQHFYKLLASADGSLIWKLSKNVMNRTEWETSRDFYFYNDELKLNISYYRLDGTSYKWTNREKYEKAKSVFLSCKVRPVY